IAAQLFFPEFKNDIHSSNYTAGKHQYYKDIFDSKFRVPTSDYRIDLDKNRNLILIFGDSITCGYGLDYEDIYWVQLQRKLDLYLQNPVRVIGIGGYAETIIGSGQRIVSKINKIVASGIKIEYLIYQFNYNDILPYSRDDLFILSKGKIDRQEWFIKIAKFRYEYLNKSVFLRVLQHYIGRLKTKPFYSCKARGLYALNEYTWSYGYLFKKAESEKLWAEFDENLKIINTQSNKLGVKFLVLVSPLLYDIDVSGRHKEYNSLNLDFSCATINPKYRLVNICNKNNIPIIDSTSYIKDSFERRVKGGNFTPYFLIADADHFNEVTAGYLSDYMAAYFLKEQER
ncbi:MAG: hypothetical protein ACYDEX_18150, partial [Mobilitalea sp.]